MADDDVTLSLHPEHGLNATLPQCFWCKKLKGGITPLGDRIAEAAPAMAVLDYEPCRFCKSKMVMGVCVIEMDTAEALQQPEMLAGLAPTGRWFVLTDQRFKEVAVIMNLSDVHIIPVLANRRMLVEQAVYERMKPADESRPVNRFVPKSSRKRVQH